MSKNVQFQANSKKNEKDSYVRGSNGIYVFQFQNGSSFDLLDEFKNYLEFKVKGTAGEYHSHNQHIGEVSWGFFKKPDNMDYDTFIKEIDKNNIPIIGYSTCIPTGRNYAEVDMNGNILVATINSKLDNRMDTGNMLINGQTGEVIRKPQPSTVIHSANNPFGYYPIEIYRRETDKETGKIRIVSKEFNFLTPDGKLLSTKTNFGRAISEETEKVALVDRNFYDRDGKVISDWNIYPQAVICQNFRDVTAYPSALDLLKDYRVKKENGEHTPNISELQLLCLIYDRKESLDEVTERIGMRFDNGEITDTQYDKILKILNAEYDKMDEFCQNDPKFIDYAKKRSMLEDIDSKDIN